MLQTGADASLYVWAPGPDLDALAYCGRRAPRGGTAGQSLHVRASLKRPPTRVYPRGAPFGAIIPGDGVAEQVFTTGIQSFLCAPARGRRAPAPVLLAPAFLLDGSVTRGPEQVIIAYRGM